MSAGNNGDLVLLTFFGMHVGPGLSFGPAVEPYGFVGEIARSALPRHSGRIYVTVSGITVGCEPAYGEGMLAVNIDRQ